jgi:DNA-binding transcriptional MerR regulator
LQQIVSLRQMGFPLVDIGGLLKRRDASAAGIIHDQIARLRQTIALQQHLVERLETITRRLDARGKVDVEDSLWAIQVMTMFEK